AVREGVKAIVEGEVSRIGSGYLITARLVSSDGEELASFRESARDADALIPAVDDLSKRLREKIGESLKSVHDAKPLDRVTTSSVAALRSYTQAVHALDVEGDTERGQALLEDAIAKDTNFAMAYRKLAVSLNNQGQRLDRAVSAMRKAFEKRDRLPDVERYMTEGSYYTARDPDRAISAYNALLELQPTNRAALNNLALLYSYRRDFARAEETLQRAVAADSGTFNAYINLADARVHAGNTAGARQVVEEIATRFPRVPVTATMRANLMYLDGRLDSAESTLRAHLAANPGNPRVRTDVAGSLMALARARGQIAKGNDFRRDLVAAQLERNQRGAALVTEIGPAFDEVWFYDRPERAREKLEQVVTRIPLNTIPPLERPYLQLGAVWSMVGRPERARQLLSEFEAVVDTSLRRAVAPQLHALRGFIALGERRTADALAEMLAADEGPCAACTLPYLGFVYDQAGNADSSIAVYERYVASKDFARLALDGNFLAHAHRRLGELYDARGDREKAIEHFSRFIELWKDADPALQPRVEDAKRRLELLRRQEG
ncbi:MAG TPA: tetratricopeptide repeat protein, partial [Gemmatimonadaceae bacterium]|nr:tetratricopeptide repeat protein [Gemmatimonadaceae bacterium]